LIFFMRLFSMIAGERIIYATTLTYAKFADLLAVMAVEHSQVLLPAPSHVTQERKSMKVAILAGGFELFFMGCIQLFFLGLVGE